MGIISKDIGRMVSLTGKEFFFGPMGKNIKENGLKVLIMVTVNTFLEKVNG